MAIDESRRQRVSDIIMSVLLRKLLKPATSSAAYQMGLINSKGQQIREPRNKREEEAITSLDKVVWKIQRMLGGRINELQLFSYLNSFPEEIEDYLYTTSSVWQRSQVTRAKVDLKKLDQLGR